MWQENVKFFDSGPLRRTEARDFPMFNNMILLRKIRLMAWPDDCSWVRGGLMPLLSFFLLFHVVAGFLVERSCC